MRALELGKNGNPQLRIKAVLFAAARLSYLIGQLAHVEKLLKEALDWAQANDQIYEHAWAIGYLGLYQEVEKKNRVQAIKLCKKAESLFRKSQPNSFGLAWMLNGLGVLYALEKDLSKSADCYEESLEISQRIGNVWGAQMALLNLSLIAYHHKEYKRSKAMLDELFATQQTNRLYDYTTWIFTVGLLCEATDQTEAAIILLSGVDKLLASNPWNLPTPEDRYFDECLIRLKKESDQEIFERAWEEGQLLPVGELFRYAQNIEVN